MLTLFQRRDARAAPYRAARLATALLAATLMAGCQALTHAPAEPGENDPPIEGGMAAAASEATDASTSFLTVMQEGQWSLRITPAGQTPGADAARWRHPGLEDLLARPEGERPKFHRLLDNPRAVVAGNAAIAVARLHDHRAAEPLAAAVRNPTLEMSMRRAAAEAFASLGQPNSAVANENRHRAAEIVGELLAQYGDFRNDALSRYLPDLHAELVRSHARLRPDDLKPLVDALASPATVVRLDALRSWPSENSEPLPPEVADLCSDVDPQVRAAALQLCAATRSPQAHELLVHALRDYHIPVRLVAVKGLGSLGGDSSRAALEELLENPSDAIRAAAVEALAEMGAWPELFAAAHDSAWQVRLAVAASLRSDTDPRAVDLAEQLLDDASSRVGRQTVGTLGNWPLPEAGPLLLGAMQAETIAVRKAAAATLAERWGSARSFPYDALPARRDMALAQLRQDWVAEFGAPPIAAPPQPDKAQTVAADVRSQIESLLDELSNPTTPSHVRQQTARSLVDLGPPVLVVLESLVKREQQVLPPEIYQNVLPELDPIFLTLLGVESSDIGARRRAATSLAETTRSEPLSALALSRLAQLAITEQDAVVWTSIETALADDVRSGALELHYAAMSHPAPEVRRRACRYLAAHADPGHQAVLLAALTDDSTPVVIAAVEALALTGPLANPEPLANLLSGHNPAVRLAAGTSLAKLGHDRGEATLERLARSDDTSIRRRTAEAMGEVGSSTFVPTLIGMLDDRLGIRRAALNSLVQIVGRDVTVDDLEAPPSLNEQITRWRRWHANQ